MTTDAELAAAAVEEQERTADTAAAEGAQTEASPMEGAASSPAAAANLEVDHADPSSSSAGAAAAPAAAPPSNTAAATTATPTPAVLPLRNKHCHFVLLAEFDIDRGSTLAHQYPAPIGHDDHILAELMLPDGAHARSEDWTVFFLKQTSPRARNKRASAMGHTSGASGAGATAPSLNGEAGKPAAGADTDIIYVLNLVRTKHDNTVRR